MFKLIGALVVYGFALYGVMECLQKRDRVMDADKASRPGDLPP